MKEEVKNCRIDIKFFGAGRIDPILKDFIVHEQMNKKDEPTGYAWFFYESTQAELDALLERFSKSEASFKIIGVDNAKMGER